MRAANQRTAPRTPRGPAPCRTLATRAPFTGRCTSTLDCVTAQLADGSQPLVVPTTVACLPTW